MNQLYAPAEVTGTPQYSSAFSLREFNLTARGSNTHGKRASENKVKLHHLTLRGKISEVEPEKPYRDTSFLFAR